MKVFYVSVRTRSLAFVGDVRMTILARWFQSLKNAFAKVYVWSRQICRRCFNNGVGLSANSAAIVNPEVTFKPNCSFGLPPKLD